MRRTQLGESAENILRCLGALEGVCEQVDDVVVAPEIREVFEREVDSAGHRAGAAQVTEFVELSLSAGHAVTLLRRADRPLLCG